MKTIGHNIVAKNKKRQKQKTTKQTSYHVPYKSCISKKIVPIKHIAIHDVQGIYQIQNL